MRPCVLLQQRPINFLINYQKAKLHRTGNWKNKFQTMPKEIAKYLTLEQPESYIGHAFRRTSTTLLAEFEADIMTLKPRRMEV